MSNDAAALLWFPLDGIWHASAGRGAYHLDDGRGAAKCRPRTSVLYEDGGLTADEAPQLCQRCKAMLKSPKTKRVVPS